MEKKDFFAPLASGLGATRRVAVLLFVMMLTTATAWAQDPAWLKQGDSWDETTKTLTVNTATVASSAYQGNTQIENVIISNSVTSIGQSAFFYCTNLKTVLVGNGVTSIGQSAFFNCTNLKTVIMTRTSSAPQITNNSFYQSPNLKIYVPMDNNGNILPAYNNYYNNNYLVGSWLSGTCAAGLKNGVLTVVGIGALEGYLGPESRGDITSVVIEDGVTSIGKYAFASCSNLEAITVDGGNAVYDSRDNCNAIIEKSSNTLIAGCKNTTIPDGVTSIGPMAFKGSGLTSITIPDGVQSIGGDAFNYCSNLESVHIGSGVASIGEYAFSGCHKLAIITVDAGNQTFDSRDGCNAIIRKADNTLVAGCKTTVIPNSVQSIGKDAFNSNAGLTSITIPNSVTSIGAMAFMQCDGLRSVTIGSGVTSIGDRAFVSCNALESVTLNGVATIGTMAFDTYVSLTTVTIAEGLILYNGTELLSGAITDMSKLNGKTLLRCYSVTLPEHVTASGTAGVLNDIIYALPDATVTISAATGYTISNIAVNGTPISGNSFTMPGDNVTVTATWLKLMTNEDITIANIDDQIYTGSAIEPVVTVKDGEATLILDTDYTIEYSDNTNVGTATATITGIGNYTGTKEATFTIVYPTVTTSYVDASGTLHENVIAIPLDNTMTTLAAGWYVVNENVDYTGKITLGGDVTLILADGCTMNIVTKDELLYATIMNCQHNNLTIYGQSEGTGWLKAYCSFDYGIYDVKDYTQHSGNVFIFNDIGACINANNSVALHGGTLDVESQGSDYGEIIALRDINILGGKLWARNKGLKTMNGKIILGYTNATDEIYAYSYQPQNGLQIAAGQTLVNEFGEILSGALYNYQLEQGFNDRTLKPVMGVTLTKEGSDNISAEFDGTSLETVSIPVNITVNSVTLNRTFTYNKCATLMLPFSLSEGQTLNGGTLYKFDGVNNGEGDWVATLSEFTSPLKANTPYLIKPNGHMTDDKITFDLKGGTVTLNTTTAGEDSNEKDDLWDFIGTYSYIKWTTVTGDQDYSAEREAEIGKVYGFAAVEKTGIHVGDFVRVASGAKIRPMCAYLKWKGSIPNNARALTRAATNDDTELPQRITVKLVSASGETTAIGTLDTTTGEVSFDSEAWYTLDGVRLSGKPSKKGLYINNGKKIVIR